MPQKHDTSNRGTPLLRRIRKYGDDSLYTICLATAQRRPRHLAAEMARTATALI
jgi:hypothetical protein